MRFGKTLRRYWPEMLLLLAVALPWLSLLALGIVWLWQGGYVWAWAIAAAVLGLLAWPLSTLVRRRANAEARLALGDIAEPSSRLERPSSETRGPRCSQSRTQPHRFHLPRLNRSSPAPERPSRRWRGRFHPEADSAWAQFSLPEVLLLAERLCRDVRREALRHIPGIRTLRLGHLVWLQQQNERYGAAAQTGWRVGFGLWRLVRAALNPLQAAGQETNGMIRGEDRKRPLLSSARIRDADAGARGRPRCHRPLLRPTCAIGR